MEKIPIKEDIYNSMDVWFKTRSIITGCNLVTISYGTFQSRGTAIMAVDELSCILISTGQ